jgi:hypothetical protein
MPRSNRPKRSRQGKAEEPELNRGVLYGVKRTEIKRGIEFTVQTHSGSSSEESKAWTCPYCNQRIALGTGHIVAWDEHRGSDGRRHFHTECWKKFQGPLL